MPIPINLKQILQSDTQQEKLDKVNYNFDQLVANGGGPMGVTGDIGEAGLQGVTGDQGPQGIEGSQGFQGPADDSADSRWKDGASWTNGSLRIKTIVPKHEIDSFQTSANFAPTNVVLGLANNDAEYNDAFTIANAVLDSVLTINKNSNYHESNIRLIAEKDINSYLDITLTNYPGLVAGDPGTSALEFEFAQSVINGEYRWNADKYVINDVNGNEMMSMDATNGATFTGSFLSTSSAIFTGSIFRINNGTGASTDPDVDKIAVSLDNLGTIGFKTASEVGASVPIGTIVSFHYDTYIDISNFTQTQAIDVNDNPEQIDIVVGRGIASTQYEGWYLCNGQTWKNANIQYTVPNLNSFSFDFTSGGIQILSAPGANTPNLLGGGEFEFQQNANTINYSIDVNSTEAWVTQAQANYASTEYKVVKTPQLIYLGAPDLWYNVTAPPPVPAFFEIEPVLGAVAIQQDLSQLGSYRGRISSYGINGDNGSVFYANPSIDLEYNKPALIYVKVTGKSYIAPPSNNLQLQEPTTSKYSWFVNWNERMYVDNNVPSNFSTGPWNDRGDYDPGVTYSQGDVFFLLGGGGAGQWYTLAKGLSSWNEAQMQNLGSNFSPEYACVNSSWSRFDSVEGAYFYKLPWVNQHNDNNTPHSYNEGDGWNNVWQPTQVHPITLPGQDDMLNMNLEGSYQPGTTNSIGYTSNNSFYDSTNSTHIFPPNRTINANESLVSSNGAFTQPIQVLLEPESNGTTGETYEVIPVVNSYNISEIQSLYPQLNVTNSHLVQYTSPHGYTDTNQYWDETNYLDYDIDTYGGSDKKHLNGNYTIDSSNNPTAYNSVHSWRPNQLDTDFRRYKSVIMTVLLEPDAVNKILDNGSTIKLGLAHWEDSGAYGAIPFIPSNSQPLGSNNVIEANNQFEEILLPDSLTTTLGGGTDFVVSDYVNGAGTGNDTVPYNVYPNTTAPNVEAGIWALFFTATVGAPDANGDGIITLQSIMPCGQGNQSSNAVSFTITHPDDSTLEVEYDGYYSKEECQPAPQATTHEVWTIIFANTTLSYTDSSGMPATAMIPSSANMINPSIICGYNLQQANGLVWIDTNNLCY